MSKKYFKLMEEEINILNQLQIEGRSHKNTSYVMSEKSMIGGMIRSMHMVKAFCRKKHLVSVECGDYECGNFRKALREAIHFMKEYSGGKDMSLFVDWVNEGLSKKSATYCVEKNKNINVGDI